MPVQMCVFRSRQCSHSTPICSYVFYTHPRPATHWLVLNGALIVLYTLVMIAGAAAAVRGIILDAQAR